MCARFTIRKPKNIPGELHPDVVEADLTQARFNVAPTQTIPVLLIRERQRMLVDCRWGLIPSWASDPAIGSRLINARAETLADKPSFRRAFHAQRCLIPADGFYEWQATDNGRQPVYIQVRQGELFTLAGLYEIWQPQGRQPLRTCTIITTTPNELIRPIHDRMPVILPASCRDSWLDPELTDVIELGKMLQPFDAALMNTYPVTRQVNSPANNDQRCIEPA